MVRKPDRRHAERIPASFPIRILVGAEGSGEFREGRAADLSASGVRFSMAERVPDRAGLIVELRMPGVAPVRSLAVAAWVRPLDGRKGFEVGSPFVDQTTASRLRIERFLHAAPALPAL